jgi:hypothetical protein
LSHNIYKNNNTYNDKEKIKEKKEEISNSEDIQDQRENESADAPLITDPLSAEDKLLIETVLQEFSDSDIDIPSSENIDADFDTLSPEELRQKYYNPVVLTKSTIRFLKKRLEQTGNELAHEPNNKSLLDDYRDYQAEIVKEKKKLDSLKSSIRTEISEEVSRVV